MIGAVVLAAGAARRYGGPKQVLEHHGVPLVRRTAQAALDAGCAPVVVVVGAHAAETREAISSLPVAIVVNPAWEEGLGASIRCGVGIVAREPRVTGVLLLLSDQPAVDAKLIERVLAGGVRTTACAYAGTVGPPALFPRSCFGRLLALTGDRGAKSVLLDEPEIVRIDWPAGALDVDAPPDRPRDDLGL
jgi:molybdenum cofactor cytidylyltransferase